MNIERIINVIDSHTQGEPTRIITGGLLDIYGATMAEKKQYVEEHLDYLRNSLMQEPRGHRDMFGAILTRPTDARADLGVIFMDAQGYVNMCGHGTIGSVTVMLETGLIRPKPEGEPYLIETPAGLVRAFAKMEQGSVREVSFENVPAFVYETGVAVALTGGRSVRLDICFGGNFFALVNAADLGLSVDLRCLAEIKTLAMEILGRVNGSVSIRHPLLPHIKSVDLVEIYDDQPAPGADARNVVIFGNAQYDRSPCGTGTCAKIALLYAQKQLCLGQKFIYESIHGTRFIGEAVRTCQINGFNGIIPKITGNAYITGIQNIIIDKNDPFKYGLTT